MVNAPDGLATYWAHALLNMLQGTREETTLRAHTSVVLLYTCCWSVFECIWRATPQPCLRVVHIGYVMSVAYVCYILEKPFRYFVHFSFLSACHASWRQLSQRTLERTQNPWWTFSSPSICSIIAYLCICLYKVHLLVCAIVFLSRCKPRYIPIGTLAVSPHVRFARTVSPRRHPDVLPFSISLRLPFRLLVPPVLCSKTVVICNGFVI